MPEPFLSNDLAPLISFLKQENEPGPKPFFSIGADGLKQASALLRLKPCATMLRLLEFDIWPQRFIRNRGVLASEEQIKLLNSRAVIIGCGGLGGYVITLLARIGLGALVLCDRDHFEESNLNRQLLCRENNIGRNKAEAAADEVASIASHINVKVWPEEANLSNLSSIICESDIVLDCLDSISARRQVEAAAHQAGVPFVHGSIAGEEGFALITRPGENSLASLYGNQPATEERNAEHLLGVPTITPAFLACLQATLAIRELLGRKPKLKSLYHIDLSVPLMEGLDI